MVTGPASGPAGRGGVGGLLQAALAALQPRLPAWQWKILNALGACGTPALGGHRYRCAQCGAQHFVPHHCRNRHCPACQGAAARDWLERQQACLLAVPYFHLVFTLPHELNPLIQQNQRAVLNLLFGAATQTVLEFGRNRFGVALGLTAVLHTWGQRLLDHYHLHVVVSGGGLSSDAQRWVSVPPHYLFSVHALARVFRAKFCEGLQALHASSQLDFHGQLEALRQPRPFQRLIRQATRQAWNVYAKRPFGGPSQVLAYLSRYTHRVALSPRRLLDWNSHRQTVTFSYKDYAQGHRNKTMTLGWAEFLRRFCLHLLPPRFVKIRHYGLLGNRGRAGRVQRARQLIACEAADARLAQPSPAPPQTLAPKETTPFLRCPQCGSLALELIEIVPASKAPRIDSS